MQIRHRKSKITFRELQPGDLFYYHEGDNSELYMKADCGAYKTTSINAINLEDAKLESFGINTIVEKVTGKLIID